MITQDDINAFKEDAPQMKPQIKATYIDHMGNDLTVANAARVSFGKTSEMEDDPWGPPKLKDRKSVV